MAKTYCVRLTKQETTCWDCDPCDSIGKVQILGTDSHNMTSRPPNMEKAIGSLEQHRMEAELDTILRANEAVFRTSVER